MAAMSVLILDSGVALRQVALLRRELPGVQLLYAVKALDDPVFLTLLGDHVDGFDVASRVEVDRVLDLGVDPARLSFSNPVKVPGHVSHAYARGLRVFAADSPGELTKLAQLAPDCGVILRLAVAATGAHFPLASKFGVEPDRVLALAERARGLGLAVRGVTFHVGSQCTNAAGWSGSIALAIAAVHSLRTAGHPTRTLNLGGGFPIWYQPGQELAFIQVAAAIRNALTALDPECVVAAEPGRFIAGPAGTVHATVIGLTERAGSPWLHLDIGAYGGFVEVLVDPNWRYPVANITRAGQPPDRAFTLTGPTCDSTDSLGAGYLLPAASDIGDVLAFSQAGAYTAVCATPFNGFAPPQIRFVHSGEPCVPAQFGTSSN